MRPSEATARSEAGQTTTEYLMITAFFTGVALLVVVQGMETHGFVAWMPWYSQFLQNLVTWLLEG